MPERDEEVDPGIRGMFQHQLLGIPALCGIDILRAMFRISVPGINQRN